MNQLVFDFIVLEQLVDALKTDNYRWLGQPFGAVEDLRRLEAGEELR